MATFHTSVPSALRAEDLFAYMAEFSNARLWDPGVATGVNVTEGPLRLGSQFLLGVIIGKKTLPFTYEITSFDPPNSVTLIAETDSYISEDTITVNADGEGSILHYRANLIPKGLLGRYNPFLGLVFRSIGERARKGLVREIGRGA